MTRRWKFVPQSQGSIDLYIETDRLSLCSILLGRTSIPREIEAGSLFMSRDVLILETMDR